MISVKIESLEAVRRGYTATDRETVVAFAADHGIHGGFHGVIRELAKRGLAVHHGFLETAVLVLPEEDDDKDWDALIVAPDAYLDVSLRGDTLAMARALGVAERFTTILDLFAAIGAIDTANPDGGMRYLVETLLGEDFDWDRPSMTRDQLHLPLPWF